MSMDPAWGRCSRCGGRNERAPRSYCHDCHARAMRVYRQVKKLRIMFHGPQNGITDNATLAIVRKHLRPAIRSTGA